MVGYIHSMESFGTVDGPGIRFVVFLQGCPMRCLYCHNPDTWKTGTGTEVTVDDILKKYDSVKAFLKNGGITVTGGLCRLSLLQSCLPQQRKKVYIPVLIRQVLPIKNVTKNLIN